MTNSWRFGLGIVALMGVVFGVTYLSNFTGSDREEPGQNTKKSDVGKVLPLRFQFETALPNPDHPLLRDFQTDYDLGAPIQQDFWFQNLNDYSLNLSLSPTTCTCTGAKLGIVQPELYSSWMETRFKTGAGIVPALSLGASPIPDVVAGIGLAVAFRKHPIRWEPFDMNAQDNFRVVPAARSKDQPTLGVIRLEGKTKSGKNMTAQILITTPDGAQRDVILRVHAYAGVPFRATGLIQAGAEQLAQTNELLMPVLGPGGSQSTTFYVYSTSRTPESLGPVDVILPDNDPCFSVSKPLAISPSDSEFQKFQKFLEQSEQRPTRLLTLYRVTISVQEQVAGKQMDYGPFERRVVVQVPNEEKNALRVRGTVKGEIEVRGPSGLEFIDFGPRFSVRTGSEVTARIRALRPGLKLETGKDKIERIPDYLEVELKERPEADGYSAWELKVTIPPGKMTSQELAGNSAIVLQTVGEKPRKFRIPVRAIADDR